MISEFLTSLRSEITNVITMEGSNHDSHTRDVRNSATFDGVGYSEMSGMGVYYRNGHSTHKKKIKEGYCTRKAY